ncbi:MAG: outer membrane beta-barrel family protein [Bacteroidia bacterium]|nr:outer membrane beta-barrel family protein [Bacteroidia bacterium]
MHKLTTLLLILLYGGVELVAQSGKISARISDEEGLQNFAFAEIALYQLPDSNLIDGTLADSIGNFSLKRIPNGSFYLAISFLGYETTYSSSFEVKAGQSLDLGVFKMKANELLLEEIEISGRKKSSFHQADRQIFSADQYRQAQGGSASDLLKNLPSLSMDALGNISLRGSSGFILMVNGKRLEGDPLVFLNQISANSIENIEIITTASAKYDPDGKAGIINIQTRQSALNGLYILGNLQLGLPSIEDYDNKEQARRYGADVTINYKNGKWDLATGLDYRRNDIGGRRVGYVNTYQNEILTEFPSYGERSFDRESYSARFSAVYSPTKKQSISTSIYAGKRTQYRTADILYDFQQRSFIPEENFLGPQAYWDLYQSQGRVLEGSQQISELTYFNENLRVRKGDFLIGALDYDLKFTDNSSLKLSGLYERTILGGPTDNNSLAWPNTRDTLQLQVNDNDNPLDGLRLQADYSRKWGDLNWESGYQYRYLSHPGDFIYLDKNLQTGEWIPNPTFTNRIELKRTIHSIYNQFSGKENKLSYSGGLRLEYMDREVRTASPDTLYSLDLLSLFPNLSLSYDLGDGFLLKGGYSRRIQRTTTFKMTPFPEREHSETLEQGDAELLPEFVNQIEAGLVKNWGEDNAFLSLYYRKVRDVINRVNSIYNDSILNRIYTNAGNAQAFGLEMGSSFHLSPKWNLYLGGNVYNYRIKGDLFGERINTSNTIFSFNASSSYQFSSSFDIQAAFNYLSRRVTAQGEDSRFYNPSLTIRKSFLNNRLSFNLQWTFIDMGILESNEQRITTLRNNFYTTTNYIYEVDVIRVGLTYRLNQASKKVKLIKSEFGDKEF